MQERQSKIRCVFWFVALEYMGSWQQLKKREKINMNPIKLKLNWDYFLEKVERLITDEQDKLKIQVRKTGEIITYLKKYIHDRNIINEDFWGYGIEQVTNGIKTIEQSSNPQAGYLLTLFKLESDSLKFFFVRLSYNSGTVDEILRPLNLKLRFIEKTTYSTDSILGILSEELDEGLYVKVDNVINARYYSGEIPKLKENLQQKIGTKQELSFIEKTRMVLQKLKDKPERKGELTELLSELKIDFILDDIVDYSNYFDETNYARTGLYKGGCFLTLTNFGIDYLNDISTKEPRPIQNNQSQVVPIKQENIKEKLRNLIGDDKIEEAFSQIIGVLGEEEKDIKNQIYLLKSRFRENLKKNRINVINENEYSLTLNQIRLGLLQIIGEMEIENSIIDQVHIESVSNTQVNDFLSIAASQSNLSAVHWSLGDLPNAKIYLKKAIETIEKLSEQSPTSYMINHGQYLHNLSVLNMESGNIDEAIENIKQTLEIYGNVLGESHPNYEISMKHYKRLIKMKT